MYELEATAFRNFGITNFFFPSETTLTHPLSLTPFWIQHTCLIKRKIQFLDPL
jgi:hypothetical protein